MKRILSFMLFLFAAFTAFATVFGTVRGIVHDPQHRPVSGIQIVLKAKDSGFTLTAQTDSNGEFHFDTVPLGQYAVTVSGVSTARTSSKLRAPTAPTAWP